MGGKRSETSGEKRNPLKAKDQPSELRGSVKPKLDAGRLLSDRQAACHYHIEVLL